MNCYILFGMFNIYFSDVFVKTIYVLILVFLFIFSFMFVLFLYSYQYLNAYQLVLFSHISWWAMVGSGRNMRFHLMLICFDPITVQFVADKNCSKKNTLSLINYEPYNGKLSELNMHYVHGVYPLITRIFNWSSGLNGIVLLFFFFFSFLFYFFLWIRLTI